jgi:hypothetical protein
MRTIDICYKYTFEKSSYLPASLSVKSSLHFVALTPLCQGHALKGTIKVPASKQTGGQSTHGARGAYLRPAHIHVPPHLIKSHHRYLHFLLSPDSSSTRPGPARESARTDRHRHRKLLAPGTTRTSGRLSRLVRDSRSGSWSWVRYLRTGRD